MLPCQVTKISHTLNQLDLTNCDLGSTPEILLVILQSDIKYNNLDNNNIDSLGAVKIAEYLGSNPPIEVLSLDHNRLNDDNAIPILISQALKRNTNIEHIHLRLNNIMSIGVKALLTCVFDSQVRIQSHSGLNVFIFRPDYWRYNFFP